MWPHKFTNVTNGVTPRRWLASCNPALTEVLDEYVGPDWVSNMDKLKQLEEHQHDSSLLEKVAEAKILGKHRLAECIASSCGILVDPSS